MVDVFKSKHERDILLGRCRALEAESYKVSDGRESDRLFDASRNQSRIFETITNLDPVGLSNMQELLINIASTLLVSMVQRWWDHYSNVDGINCEHAQTIRSAHHGYGMMERLHNKNMFYIGPQIPYVIPYLLDMDSMIAVITEHAFPCGDTFYTTVYFTENPPPRYKLRDPWDRRPMVITKNTTLGMILECTGTST